MRHYSIVLYYFAWVWELYTTALLPLCRYLDNFVFVQCFNQVCAGIPYHTYSAFLTYYYTRLLPFQI